jgi:hypothetical protein
MKRVVIASLGAVTLVASLPFINQTSALMPIKSANNAVAQSPQKQSLIAVRLEGEKQVLIKDAEGKAKVNWAKLTGNVKPGDVVRYTVLAENKSDRTIKNLILNGPIPKFSPSSQCFSNHL